MTRSRQLGQPLFERVRDLLEDARFSSLFRHVPIVSLVAHYSQSAGRIGRRRPWFHLTLPRTTAKNGFSVPAVATSYAATCAKSGFFVASARAVTPAGGRRPALVFLSLVVVVLVGCGGSTGAPRSAVAKPRSRCERVARDLRATIADGVTIKGKVTRVGAVKSKDADQATIPGYRRSGLYFVSAKVDDGSSSPVVLTWATDGDSVRTGGGLLIAADAGARKWSHLGDQAAAGVGPGNDGWQESRDCVE